MLIRPIAAVCCGAMMIFSGAAAFAADGRQMPVLLNDGYRVVGYSTENTGDRFQESFVLSKGASLFICAYNGSNQKEEFCVQLN